MNPKLELTQNVAPDARKMLYAELAAHNGRSVAAVPGLATSLTIRRTARATS